MGEGVVFRDLARVRVRVRVRVGGEEAVSGGSFPAYD